MSADSAGRAAWVGVALCLGACALTGWLVDRASIDWQPQRAAHEPWRVFSAVGVHYSGQHLAVNLAGLAVTALYGLAARVPVRLSIAWLAAWPLTHAGLLLRPELAHYGGLSGVLHAGVAVATVSLLLTGTRAQRLVAGAVAIGLGAKLLGEAPWGPVLRHPPDWDIAVAPLAHTTGAIAGTVCAGLALWLDGDRRPTADA